MLVGLLQPVALGLVLLEEEEAQDDGGKAQGHEDQLIGLNYKDKRADALGWLGRHGNPFFASIADEDGRLAIDLGVYGAPETFVIYAQGVMRFKHVGALTDELIRTRIVPLLEVGR